MIELRNVSVSVPRGHTPASTILRDITLSIGDGEWVMLAGPNGSGKTTLLKTIARLLPPRTGDMVMNGIGAPGTIALLLQEPDNQFVASSVRNELLLSLPRSAGESERRERLDQAIDQFSLLDLDRNPHRLSGGEKQRLALATVWLSEPRLLLLDEPTSYLDAVETARCVRFVEELNRDGVTVVWATPTAAGLPSGRRLVYLDRGRLEFDGPAERFHRDHEGDRLADAPRASAPRATASDPGGPVAVLQSVGFAYEDRAVFDDLSLEVREGDTLTVAGHNGAGKSTLLGLLGGVLEPTRGRVLRKYRRNVESGTQNVFFLFQNPERLFFAETVFEEIAFGLKALKIPKSEAAARVDDALARVGLPPGDFRDRMPFSLSLGEMRRLAFAITLALDPRLVLLDEPASCLDALGWTVLLDLLEHFQRRGRTLVVASHDVARLARATSRVIELPPPGARAL
jgi:energy-coupling factor transport system ATP-binding protein